MSVPFATLSSSNLMAVQSLSADLTVAAFKPVTASTPVIALPISQPVQDFALKGNAAAAARGEPLKFVSVDTDTIALDDPLARAALGSIVAIDPNAPRTNAEAGDVIAKWINGSMRDFLADAPNVDVAALQDTIKRVVHDVCANWKSGEDLVGMLRAAVGLAMWGAGVPAEVIADYGDNGIYPAFIKSGDTTPLELGTELYNVDKAWENLPPFATFRGGTGGALPGSSTVVAFSPFNEAGAFPEVDGPGPENPGDRAYIEIGSGDRITIPTALSGPFSHDVSAQLASGGIADLFMHLQGIWLSESQRRTIHDTIARVVRDVLEKSKPGDDLMGNIRTAVAIAMWGEGYQPDLIASVTQSLSAMLTKNFPGNAETALTEMGQYFAAHDASDLFPPQVPINFPFGH